MLTERKPRIPIGDAKKAAIIAMKQDDPDLSSVQIASMTHVHPATVQRVLRAAFGRNKNFNGEFGDVDLALNRYLDRVEGSRRRIMRGCPRDGDVEAQAAIRLTYWGHENETLMMA